MNTGTGIEYGELPEIADPGNDPTPGAPASRARIWKDATTKTLMARLSNSVPLPIGPTPRLSRTWYVDVSTIVPSALRTGAPGTPFATRQAAIAAIPAATGAATDDDYYAIVDAAGTGQVVPSTENLTLPARRKLTLEGQGGGVNLVGDIALNNAAAFPGSSVVELRDFNTFGKITLSDDGFGVDPNGYVRIDGTIGTRHQRCGGDSMVRTVIGATNATPIEIQTSAAHGYLTGDRVLVVGVTGNTAANSGGTQWVIIKTADDKFTLTGSVGNGAWVSGGHSSNFKSAILDLRAATRFLEVAVRNAEMDIEINAPTTAVSGSGAFFVAPITAYGSVDYQGFRDCLFHGLCHMKFTQPNFVDTRFLDCRFYVSDGNSIVDATNPGTVGFDSASWRSFMASGWTLGANVQPVVIGGFDAGRQIGATLTDASLIVSVDGSGASGGFTGGGNYYELPTGTLTAARTLRIGVHGPDAGVAPEQTIRIRVLGPQSYNLSIQNSAGSITLGTVVAGDSGYVDVTTNPDGTQSIVGSDLRLWVAGNIVLKATAIMTLVDAAWIAANPTITMAAGTGTAVFDAGTYARFIRAGGTVGAGVTVRRRWAGVRQPVTAKISGADAGITMAAGAAAANLFPQLSLDLSEDAYVRISVDVHGRSTAAGAARVKMLVDGGIIGQEGIPAIVGIVNWMNSSLMYLVTLAAGVHTFDFQVQPDAFVGAGNFTVLPADATSSAWMEVVEVMS